MLFVKYKISKHSGNFKAISPWVKPIHSNGVTAPLFCLCSLRLESLFPPVLWKPYNQIPLALSTRFPRNSQSLCRISRLGSLKWCSELSQSARTPLVLLFSSLWVTHLAGMRFDFMVIAPQLPSCSHFFFVFGRGISFSGGFQCPPVVGCSAAGCSFGALTGGDNHTSFYSAILNQKQTSVVFNLYCIE